jgi:hypothetical protein
MKGLMSIFFIFIDSEGSPKKGKEFYCLKEGPINLDEHHERYPFLRRQRFD